jgi:hypothetical protein
MLEYSRMLKICKCTCAADEANGQDEEVSLTIAHHQKHADLLNHESVQLLESCDANTTFKLQSKSRELSKTTGWLHCVVILQTVCVNKLPQYFRH